jgi:hypothetical protein
MTPALARILLGDYEDPSFRAPLAASAHGSVALQMPLTTPSSRQTFLADETPTTSKLLGVAAPDLSAASSAAPPPAPSTRSSPPLASQVMAMPIKFSDTWCPIAQPLPVTALIVNPKNMFVNSSGVIAKNVSLVTGATFYLQSSLLMGSPPIAIAGTSSVLVPVADACAQTFNTAITLPPVTSSLNTSSHLIPLQQGFGSPGLCSVNVSPSTLMNVASSSLINTGIPTESAAVFSFELAPTQVPTSYDEQCVQAQYPAYVMRYHPTKYDQQTLQGAGPYYIYADLDYYGHGRLRQLMVTSNPNFASPIIIKEVEYANFLLFFWPMFGDYEFVLFMTANGQLNAVATDSMSAGNPSIPSTFFNFVVAETPDPDVCLAMTSVDCPGKAPECVLAATEAGAVMCPQCCFSTACRTDDAWTVAQAPPGSTLCPSSATSNTLEASKYLLQRCTSSTGGLSSGSVCLYGDDVCGPIHAATAQGVACRFMCEFDGQTCSEAIDRGKAGKASGATSSQASSSGARNSTPFYKTTTFIIIVAVVVVLFVIICIAIGVRRKPTSALRNGSSARR